jgi:hypothetical protein
MTGRLKALEILALGNFELQMVLHDGCHVMFQQNFHGFHSLADIYAISHKSHIAAVAVLVLPYWQTIGSIHSTGNYEVRWSSG